MKVETCRVEFSDGRKAHQTVYIHADGTRELRELTVYRTADNKPCRKVYAKRADLSAYVYGLNDVGNVTWQTIPGTVKVAG